MLVCRNTPWSTLLKPFESLSPDVVDRLFGRADELLEQPGLAVQGDEVTRALFEGAGAHVDGERVRFPPGLAREIIRRSAPFRFRQRARNPARSVVFGDGGAVLSPALGPPFVRDSATGRRRYGTLDDARRIARLVQVADELGHAGGGWCEPSDRGAEMRHMDLLYAALTLTDKPVKGGGRTPEHVADNLAMTRIAFGEDIFERECCLLSLFNVESPLVLTEATSRGLRMSAAAGQASQVGSYSMMGMTSPVTAGDALALMLAEVQAGAALTQLVRPGAPVMVGIYAVPFSMSAMRPVFGAVESHMIMAAGAQLARVLGLPFRADGAVTSAKLPDAQAARDAAAGLHFARVTQSDLVLHSTGWLESGLVFSFDKFAMDLAVIRTLDQQDASQVDGRLETPLQWPASGFPAPAVDDLLAEWREPELAAGIRQALDDWISERTEERTTSA